MNPALQAKLDPQGPVVSCIRARFSGALSIYAFGSQMTDDAGPSSDLDLAVLVGGYAEPLALWQVADELFDVVGCTVDLLDLRASTTVMQYQVMTTGIRLWSAGLPADLFECFVLSEKTALETARAPLLADIAASGKVYG